MLIPAALGFAMAMAAPVDFVHTMEPLLEQQCIQCHSSGRVNLSSREAMLQSRVLRPGKPEASSLYTTVAKGAMPPVGKLSGDAAESIRAWIAAGADWPSNIALKVPAPASAASGSDAEMVNVRRIRERITASTKSADQRGPEKITIANTTVSFDVVPVKAGDFLMGSPAGEPFDKDEQPRHKVHIDAFGMQAHEVTWDEYRLFMFANQAGEIAHKDDVVDGVSRPTRPYVEMSFGMGINGFPAISMTQHAANKYAEWLSSKTEQFYRLPTEAEWEYACRAGTETTYYFGDDSAQLAEYAVFSSNSGAKYAKVATKKPNAWGLYDMLGNVMEWTLDAYEPYQNAAANNPWMKATKPYPHAVRGGSWNDGASKVRCGVRVASDASWKQQDPQLPKSIWYETDAQWLGFRLVRPAKLPSAEEMFRYWNSGVEHDEQ